MFVMSIGALFISNRLAREKRRRLSIRADIFRAPARMTSRWRWPSGFSRSLLSFASISENPSMARRGARRSCDTLSAKASSSLLASSSSSVRSLTLCSSPAFSWRISASARLRSVMSVTLARAPA